MRHKAAHRNIHRDSPAQRDAESYVPASSSRGEPVPADQPSHHPNPRRSSRMRLLLACLLLLTLVGLWNWWSTGGITRDIQSARQSLREGDAEVALTILQRAESLEPDRAELLYLLGRAYRQTGQFERARKYFERAAEQGWSPDDLRHQQRLAQIQMGQVDQAEAYLQELLREGANDELALEFFQAQAQGLLRSYRLNEALVCLDHWIQWRPRDVQPRIWRAEIWERILRWTDARSEYQAILQLDPHNLTARRRLARSLLELHEFTLASEHFQRSLEADPKNLEAAIGAAKCERWLSQLDAATRRLAQVRLREKELTVEQRTDVYSELGQIALEREEYADAISLLREALDHDPARAAAHHALGRAYARTGDSERALSHTEEARRIYAQYDRLSEVTQQLIHTPDNADLRWEAGRILMDLGLAYEGAAWMSTALLVDPNHAPTHRSLAEYEATRGGSDRSAHDRSSSEELPAEPEHDAQRHLLEGKRLLGSHQYDQALETLALAKQHPETRGKALAMTGEILYQSGNLRAAEEVLREAIRVEPQQADAHRWLAVTYYDLGAMNDAVRHLGQVTELDPTDARPSRLSGLILKDFERYSDAVTAYEESLRRNPAQKELLPELVHCLVKLRDFERALEVFQDCDPTPVALTLAAECEYSLDNAEAARRYLERATESPPVPLETYQLQATIALDSNEISTAETILQQAVAQYPKDFGLRFKLAQAYRRTGKVEQADEQLKASEELRALRRRFSDLHDKAIQSPLDAEVRYELGVAAGELDLIELADSWFRASQALDPDYFQTRQAQPAPAARQETSQ